MFTVKESVAILEKKLSKVPELLIILGSGWNKVLTEAEVETEIGYDQLFGVSASVPGHEGKLVIAKVEGKRVAFMAGRFHTYEGYTSEEVTRPLQALAEVGLKRVVVTSAAGALNEKYRVGDFVILSDLITAYGMSPLTGPEFVDMSEVFDPVWREQTAQAAGELELSFHDGVYVQVRGPHFETPADKMKYRHDGADVIGMSTVPESIMARKLGLKILGLSFVTNLAFVKHDHHDVLAAANEGSRQMVELLKKVM